MDAMICDESETVTMQISNRFSIAVHMIACMEYFKNDHKITSEFLANSVGVNPVIIRKITSQLRDGGLVNVARGTGGVSLAKAPEAMEKELSAVTVADIIKDTEKYADQY